MDNYNFPTVPKIINQRVAQDGSRWIGEDGGWWYDCFTDVGASPVSNSQMTRWIVDGLEQGVRWRVPHIIFDEIRDQDYPNIVGSHLDIDDPRVFYSNGGSEAIEVAMKLIRRATGRNKIISIGGDFHGRGYGALALSYREPHYHHDGFGLPLRDIYIYQPRSGGVDAYAFDTSTLEDEPIAWDQVAGVVISPINGNNTLHKWSEDVWDIVAATRAAGGLVVFDEVQTGFGRAGGVVSITQTDHVDMRPDVWVFGKACGSGWPMSITIADASIVDGTMTKGSHFNTMAGSPMGCYLSIRLMDELEDGLLDRMLDRADWFHKKIDGLYRYGYMMAIDVYDPQGFCEAAHRHNVLLMTARADQPVRFSPPFDMDDSEQFDVARQLAYAMAEHRSLATRS